MNENIDLTKILKNCPKGWKLYSLIYGEVQFGYIGHGDFPITVELSDSSEIDFTKDGRFDHSYDGECVLLPSKNQRDWSKFIAPWYKKGKFDPKTLQPFDKVITKCDNYPWKCDIFSSYVIRNKKNIFCFCISENYMYGKCIPYNDETKHLVGTWDEAPEHYRYWEE